MTLNSYSKSRYGLIGKPKVSILSDLTVLILSINRPTYLERQTAFWSRTPAQILIADGSMAPNPYLQPEILSNPKVKYSWGKGIAERFGWAAQEVHTPFTLVVADDDIFSLEGVVACVHELAQHHDLGTCSGQVLEFGFNEFTKRMSISLSQARPLVTQFKGGTPLTRAIGRGTLYTSFCFYAVQKSLVSRPVWKLLSEFGEPQSLPNNLNNYLYERTYELVSTILADVGTISQVTRLVSSENNPIRETDGTRNISFQDWYQKESSQESINYWYRKVISMPEFIALIPEYEIRLEILQSFVYAIMAEYPYGEGPRKYFNARRYLRRIKFEIEKISVVMEKKRSVRRLRASVLQKNKYLAVDDLLQMSDIGSDGSFDFQGRSIRATELQSAASIVEDFHLRVRKSEQYYRETLKCLSEAYLEGLEGHREEPEHGKSR